MEINEIDLKRAWSEFKERDCAAEHEKLCERRSQKLVAESKGMTEREELVRDLAWNILIHDQKAKWRT
jgi:hypothetical protein